MIPSIRRRPKLAEFAVNRRSIGRLNLGITFPRTEGILHLLQIQTPTNGAVAQQLPAAAEPLPHCESDGAFRDHFTDRHDGYDLSVSILFIGGLPRQRPNNLTHLVGSQINIVIPACGTREKSYGLLQSQGQHGRSHLPGLQLARRHRLHDRYQFGKDGR